MQNWWSRFSLLQRYVQCERLKGIQQDATHTALAVCPEQFRLKLRLPQGARIPNQLRGTGGFPASPAWCASPGGEAGAGLSPVPAAFLPAPHLPSRKLMRKDTGADTSTAPLLFHKHRGERKSMGWGMSCSWVTFFNAGLGESFPKGIGLGKGAHTYRSSGIAKSFYFVVLNCLKGSCAG